MFRMRRVIVLCSTPLHRNNLPWSLNLNALVKEITRVVNCDGGKVTNTTLDDKDKLFL